MPDLATIFANVLGIPLDRVTDDLSPTNESRWDSLNSIILITEIEAAYGIQFGYDEAMHATTFAAVKKLVEEKRHA